MRTTVILAVTRAEIRTTLRLVHYWLFALLSVGIGCMVYVELAVTHGNLSGIASGMGTFSPQFYVGLFGVFFYLWLFVGLIFFAFDIRARDERDRIVEVLDSRPHSYEMTLVANGKRRAIEFDATASTDGWNEVGEFDLEAGAVSLEVSNKTTGNVVFADAIRWQPLRHGP